MCQLRGKVTVAGGCKQDVYFYHRLREKRGRSNNELGRMLNLLKEDE